MIEWSVDLATIFTGVLIPIMTLAAGLAYSTWKSTKELERIIVGEENVEGWDGLIGEYKDLKRWRDDRAKDRLDEHEDRITKLEQEALE